MGEGEAIRKKIVEASIGLGRIIEDSSGRLTYDQMVPIAIEVLLDELDISSDRRVEILKIVVNKYE
jgi:hypothetical protein